MITIVIMKITLMVIIVMMSRKRSRKKGEEKYSAAPRNRCDGQKVSKSRTKAGQAGA